MSALIRLAWRYLWAQPLTASLNLLLLSLGLAAISFVLLVSEQIEAGVRRDLAGIDLVVGAKGSPMQIMLSGVFHLDVPTGNIPLSTLETLRAQPLVARAVPLSLGDSLRGFRIVGTEASYLELYGASLAQGQLWRAPLQAVLGAEVAQRTGLALGVQFAGSHGLGEQGDAHEGEAYTVTGILKPTGTVIDRLVLTDLASVWQLHEAHHGSTANTALEEETEEMERREITLILLSYRSPLAAISLPRWVNAQAGLQAAAPALETARLLRLVGTGTDVLRGFAVVLLLAAGLSVWVALLNAVRARQADLAMMRMLGAPPWRVAALVGLEAAILASLACVIGLTLGHGLCAILGQLLADRQSLHLTGSWFSLWELSLPLLAASLALLASAWPAWRAYRLDVSDLLQAPR
ncbi:ABC transporter permease [Paucibacter sp. DJ1R-11]|uniref:ABC transporter permease n=1 Tax=Paucibacter sp. DJ1R-11 TaxID=2893556 RepID=UPI0021E485EC|nr:FtsX-like permease family protein [Paucibacter sp. DJ1R-11]MCV2365999.1 ABC transporter permease [Paucibacter sp. DJ1R-11]